MSLKIHSPMMVQSFEIDRLGVRSTRMRMKNVVTGFREAIPGAVALPQYVSGHFCMSIMNTPLAGELSMSGRESMPCRQTPPANEVLFHIPLPLFGSSGSWFC